MNELHETELLDRLLAVVVLLHEDATQSLAAQGLTLARAHLVWRLHHDGPSTQRALAEAMKVTPRNVTGLVDGLAAAGFVRRDPHPDDRRAIRVSLTDRGAASMAAMDRSHRELARLLFGDLPGADLAAFARGLGHVHDRLREALGR